MTPDASLPPADVAAESCYCVCHSSFSSRAWCEHCQGDNAVGRVPRCTVPDQSNAFGTCARALPCAVHPAADVQRPTPPLTEEELAEMEEGYRGTSEQRADMCQSCPKGWPLLRVVDQPYGKLHVHLAPWGDDPAEERNPYDDFVWCDDPRPDVRRLIADLRAARAEVERLNRLRAVMVTAARERAAEVERLRAQNAEYVDFIATVVRVPNAP